jgi:hypothetical protein
MAGESVDNPDDGLDDAIEARDGYAIERYDLRRSETVKTRSGPRPAAWCRIGVSAAPAPQRDPSRRPAPDAPRLFTSRSIAVC